MVRLCPVFSDILTVSPYGWNAHLHDVFVNHMRDLIRQLPGRDIMQLFGHFIYSECHSSDIAVFSYAEIWQLNLPKEVYDTLKEIEAKTLIERPYITEKRIRQTQTLI